MSRRTLIATLAVLTLGGCSRVAPGAGFADVQELARERTGGTVHWSQGTPEDKAVAEQVKAMLGRTLGADAAVQVALLNNRNLQATYEQLGIAQAALVEAGLLRNPVFDAELRFARGGGTGLELSLVQDFISILFIPLRKQIAESGVQAAKFRIAGEVLELAGETRQAFYEYQAARQIAELRQSVLAATEASYELATRLYGAGNITDLELSGEQAMWEQAKLDLAAAENEATQARERLNTLMGVWGADAGWEAETRLPDPPAEELAIEGLERRAIERSLDLQAARSEILEAAQELGLARPLALFPDSDAGAGAEREADGEWSAGPALSLPLPFFDQGQAAAAAARLRLAASRDRHAALAVEIRSRVRSAWTRTTTARERARHYLEVLIPLRERIVGRTQVQYNAMQVGAFQLLQARRDQIEAGGAYVRELLAYWSARTELDQLLNGRMPSGEAVARINAEPSASGSGPERGGH